MIVWPITGSAQHYNTYGMPGLIDMPIASSAPDAELAFSVSSFAGQTRGTATFQLSDRISASLRYAQLNDLRDADGHIHDRVFDRSFGLHYRLRDETTHWPAVAIGGNDFIGTGVYAGEYLVATKTIAPHFSATLGLGWGRLGSYGSFAHPLGGSFRDRPQVQIGEGGAIATDALFHGDTAFFGGLHYQPRDDLALVAEYSSDAYRGEEGAAFRRRSPINIGLTYMPAPNLQFAAQYLYGSEIGLGASYAYDPSTAPPHHLVPPYDPGKFVWQIKPYIVPNLFDPDALLRADFGLALAAEWRVAPGVVVAGNLRQRIAGNLDQTTRESDSILPHVRSDFAKYGREGDLDIDHLTVTWRAQPHSNVTTRLTVGLLEEMYAGASAELFWQRPETPFAVGFELNALQQRDYNGDFRLRDYQVLSGHGSLYWNAGDGYHIQVDAGRYLAGDWGGTLTLTRRFENGWSLGAFATLTDVPFDQFGEGSFDKGVMFSIPLGAHGTLAQTIRPVTRDGGARVNIDGRLYDARANVQR
jgi:hypothetical protein